MTSVSCDSLIDKGVTGRHADFTWFGGRSAAIKIDGVRNFEITDNDLYSAWISIGNGQSHISLASAGLRKRAHQEA